MSPPRTRRRRRTLRMPGGSGRARLEYRRRPFSADWLNFWAFGADNSKGGAPILAGCGRVRSLNSQTVSAAQAPETLGICWNRACNVAAAGQNCAPCGRGARLGFRGPYARDSNARPG